MNLVWIDLWLFHGIDVVKNVGQNFVLQWIYRFLGIGFTEVDERSEFSELWLEVLAGKKFVHLNLELIKKVFILFGNLIGLSFFVEELTDISFLLDDLFFLLSQFFTVLVFGVFFKIVGWVKFMLIHDFLGQLDWFDDTGFFSETFRQDVLLFFETHTFFKGASGVFQRIFIVLEDLFV